jgi:type I restriction enzyme M protein
LLAKVVDALDGVPMDDRDALGDLYEYIFRARLLVLVPDGQFRTFSTSYYSS